jgi:hypothetical protein
MAGDESAWMSTKEAAEYVGLHLAPRTASPAYKQGRVLRFRRDDLHSYLESTRVQPGELRHLYPPRKGDAPVESIVDEP